LPPTEIEDVALIEAAVRMECQFAARGYSGNSAGPALIESQGEIPIILSAPHAVNHPRNGNIKFADMFTGTLAVQAAALTGTSVLVYARMLEEDPNYDTDGPYKRRLAELVAQTQALFVLDLHGIHQSQMIELAIGTDHGKTLGMDTELLSILMNVLTKAGFTNVLVNDPHRYNAARPTTIASFTWRELGIPALQLEIHKKYRDAKNTPHDYLKMLYTLRDAIYALQQAIVHKL
jgi:hypothetical protein